jgi:hypothetical protein
MLREPTVAGIGQLAAMQTRGAVIWRGATADRRERCRRDRAGARRLRACTERQPDRALERLRSPTVHRLPAIYPSRLDAAVGGLISYGPDVLESVSARR